MDIIPSSNFEKKIRDASGVQVNLCYQCGKCSAGCPINKEMDYLPHQLIHAIRLGKEDLVLNSKTMWLCASCETCTTRCPQEVDIAKVMDTLKIMAVERGIQPDSKEVPAFYKSALNSIRRFGRVYELGMIMEMKLRTLDLFKDMKLGMRMISKGKIKILPDLSSSRSSIASKIFARVKRKEDSQ